MLSHANIISIVRSASPPHPLGTVPLTLSSLALHTLISLSTLHHPSLTLTPAQLDFPTAFTYIALPSITPTTMIHTPHCQHHLPPSPILLPTRRPPTPLTSPRHLHQPCSPVPPPPLASSMRPSLPPTRHQQHL